MLPALPLLPRSLYIFLFFIAVSFVTYHKILPSEFMLDDHAVLLAKEPGFANIGKALDYKDEGHVFFRPVTNLFRLVLISTLPKDPVYYHLLNIVLFALHLGLVFFVLKRLTGKAFAAFWACLLYGLHPVNAVFINYITGHEILLFGIFLDLSALFLLRYCDEPSNSGVQYAGVLFFVLALFTQEISIAFLFFVFLVVFQLSKDLPLKQAFRTCLPYCAAALAYAAWRVLAVAHTAHYIERMFQYSDRMSLNVLTYVNTVMELVRWYLRQLMVADQLILIKTMPAQTVGFWWNAGVLAALGLVMLFVFRGRGKGDQVFFALLWLLTGFIPLFGLALIYPYGGFVIEGHWFFFSSIGFFLCLGLFVSWFLTKFQRSILRFSILILIAMLGGFWFGKTQTYNHLLRSQESYCRYWLTISPDFYFPNFWLARDLVKQNKLEEAEFHFKKAFIGKKNDWLVYAGLGDIEAIRNNFLKTREYYLEALRLNPGSTFLKKNVEWLDQKLHMENFSQ